MNCEWSSLQEVLDMPKANQDLSLFLGVSILTKTGNMVISQFLVDQDLTNS